MGAGRMAGWFSECLKAVGDAVCYAVCSRTMEKAERFADKFGFEKAYGSYEDLLGDPEVDIIYIATPVREHFANAKMSLEAGKPVLCEKAMTINSAQAEELIALAKQKGLFFMEGLWTLCQPSFLSMKRWINEGLIGELRAVECSFYTAASDRGYRLYHKEIGGGALLDLGCYPVMYAMALLGTDPLNVRTNIIVGDAGVDYMDSVVLEYEGGRFAHLSSGLGINRFSRVFILGTKGRIEIADEHFYEARKIEALDFDNNVLATVDIPHLRRGYEYEAMEVVRCLRAGEKESPLVPTELSLSVMRVLDAARKNAGFRFEFE